MTHFLHRDAFWSVTQKTSIVLTSVVYPEEILCSIYLDRDTHKALSFFVYEERRLRLRETNKAPFVGVGPQVLSPCFVQFHVALDTRSVDYRSFWCTLVVMNWRCRSLVAPRD